MKHYRVYFEDGRYVSLESTDVKKATTAARQALKGLCPWSKQRYSVIRVECETSTRSCEFKEIKNWR